MLLRHYPGFTFASLRRVTVIQLREMARSIHDMPAMPTFMIDPSAKKKR